MIPKYYEFINPVKILSGVKALGNIPYEMKRLKAKKPIILSDGILKRAGALGKVIEAINGELDTSVIITDILSDASVKAVNQIVKIYRENKCDSIIAVGGGSVIDTAKGVKMLISQETDDIIPLMGNEIIEKGKKVPFIVVPSISGTGGECTMLAVISDTDKGLKMEFVYPEIFPDAAVLDTDMTDKVPPEITAAAGMDALCHAIEGFTGLQKNPLSDAYSISAIRLIGQYLEKAVVRPSNKEAGLAMSNASMLAGVAFSNSRSGLVHAIGNAAEGVSQIPHGEATAILMPYVMEYNMEKCEEQYAEILLHLAGPEIFASTKKEERGKMCVEVIRQMLEKFNKIANLPVRLKDTKVSECDLAVIALKSINEVAVVFNTISVKQEDVLEILKKAF